MAKPTPIPAVKYMLIDITAVEQTRLLKIAHIREIPLWGKIYQARGRKVIAPPVEGRSFAKLDKLALQYFYWNVCQETPPEDYGQLVQKCIAKINAMEVADTSVVDLEREVELLQPDTSNRKTIEKPPKDPDALPARPKGTTTTGIVWTIADELFAKLGHVPDRKTLLEACAVEEINPATASTQFCKWKKAKGI